MTLIPERVEEYFRTARVRHQIYLDRRAGRPWPWTDDSILQHWRFTNVFRELDKTTAWFRDNVRERLRSSPEVLLATVVFRFFNRIGTGEAIFNQLMVGHLGKTAWELFLATGDTDYLKHSILTYIGARGPYVTGSYIVKTPEGFTKLDGVLEILRRFYQTDWRHTAEMLLSQEPQTLSATHNWLESSQYYIGHFTAYEIVTDLRHTDLLCHAPDIMSWANAGPGATRGLNYLHGRDRGRTPSKTSLVEEMQELLELSQQNIHWPWDTHDSPVTIRGGKVLEEPLHGRDWPAWEMREVEMWLCEFFKYIRARDEGRGTRQRFRHG